VNTNPINRNLWLGKLMIFFAIVPSTERVFGGDPLACPWQIWGQLPPNVTGLYMGARGNFLYTFEDYAIVSPVGSLYAEVASDGTIGPWLRTTDRTTYRYVYGVVTTNTHVYLVGGQLQGFTNTGLVEYAAFQIDGSLGAWNATSSLNTPRESFGLVVSGDYVYALGGTLAIVGFGAGRVTEYAHINADGSLGAWQLGPQLNEDHPGCRAAVIDGYLYVFGGGVHQYQTTTVERAVLNGDGSFGPWVIDTPLPEPKTQAGVTVRGRSVYLAGGHRGTYGNEWQTSVFLATVAQDHTLSPWITTEALVQVAQERALTSVGEHLFATSNNHDLGVEHSCFSGNPVCGDGVIEGSEECDDGDTVDGDGCSSTCTIESGWGCSGAPSSCTEICGNGIVTVGEQCDGSAGPCPGFCLSNCRCTSGEVPTVSEWGLVVTALLGLTMGTALFARRDRSQRGVAS